MSRQWPHKCTIYNKYLDSSSIEHWKRTVLEGVYMEHTAGINYRKHGVTGADKVFVIIPKEVKGGQYTTPAAFRVLEDKEGWTLQEGDSFVLGVIDYEILRSDAELSNLYDEVYTITTIDHFDTGNLEHWEVGGK